MILASFFANFYKAIVSTPGDGLNYNKAFTGIGWIAILLSFSIACLFYLFFGRYKKNIWFKRSHWVITLLINFVLIFIFTILQAKWNVAGFVMFGKGFGYALKVAFINGIISTLLFFIFSIILKRWSIHSIATPF